MIEWLDSMLSDRLGNIMVQHAIDKAADNNQDIAYIARDKEDGLMPIYKFPKNKEEAEELDNKGYDVVGIKVD